MEHLLQWKYFMISNIRFFKDVEYKSVNCRISVAVVVSYRKIYVADSDLCHGENFPTRKWNMTHDLKLPNNAVWFAFLFPNVTLNEQIWPLNIFVNFVISSCAYDLHETRITHWGRDKMATILQTTYSNAFSWMKVVIFWIKFHSD